MLDDHSLERRRLSVMPQYDWAKMSARERDELVSVEFGYLVNNEMSENAVLTGHTETSFRIFMPTQNMRHAWEIVESMKGTLFSTRKRFMDELQKIVSERSKALRVGQMIAWPDVFWFVDISDWGFAALRAKGVDV